MSRLAFGEPSRLLPGERGYGSLVPNSGLLRRQLSPLEPLVAQVEAAEVLDAPGRAIGRSVRTVLSGRVKDALSGTWLGHALHPALTDVVIGSFTSATLIDLLSAEEGAAASEALISVGVAAYLPTALSGLSDWADSEAADPRVRRAGLVHAGGNALALTLYASSLALRRSGRLGLGRFVGGVGAAVLAGGGYLGGHLSLTRGVGADQTAFDPGPTEWSPACGAGDLLPGALHRVVVGDTPVLLVREGERFFAIHDRCSHRGCSLSEGSLEGEEVVCACHGSRFDRSDGALRGGPATAPQPAFETRVVDDRVEIRLRGGCARALS
jgi:nitrite reductase/ring-hydroxylating ferredoxin subunit/uncharacterized membrane protein